MTNGIPHITSLYSGSDSNGIYHYQTTLGAGKHNYYFYFIDRCGGNDRLPDNVIFTGPFVNQDKDTLSSRITAGGIGLDGDAWRQGAKFEVFEAVVFSEEK